MISPFRGFHGGRHLAKNSRHHARHALSFPRRFAGSRGIPRRLGCPNGHFGEEFSNVGFPREKRGARMHALQPPVFLAMELPVFLKIWEEI